MNQRYQNSGVGRILGNTVVVTMANPFGDIGLDICDYIGTPPDLIGLSERPTLPWFNYGLT